MREKCPNAKFFLVRIFPHSESLRIQCECGKIRTKKYPYLDTFHAVKIKSFTLEFFHSLFIFTRFFILFISSVFLSTYILSTLFCTPSISLNTSYFDLARYETMNLLQSSAVYCKSKKTATVLVLKKSNKIELNVNWN